MQFLIETMTSETTRTGARQVALCPTLADVREVAAELCSGDQLALDQLAALGSSPEGGLIGPWGEFASRRLADTATGRDATPHWRQKGGLP